MPKETVSDSSSATLEHEPEDFESGDVMDQFDTGSSVECLDEMSVASSLGRTSTGNMTGRNTSDAGYVDIDIGQLGDDGEADVFDDFSYSSSNEGQSNLGFQTHGDVPREPSVSSAPWDEQPPAPASPRACYLTTRECGPPFLTHQHHQYVTSSVMRATSPFVIPLPGTTETQPGSAHQLVDSTRNLSEIRHSQGSHIPLNRKLDREQEHAETRLSQLRGFLGIHQETTRRQFPSLKREIKEPNNQIQQKAADCGTASPSLPSSPTKRVLTLAQEPLPYSPLDPSFDRNHIVECSNIEGGTTVEELRVYANQLTQAHIHVQLLYPHSHRSSLKAILHCPDWLCAWKLVNRRIVVNGSVCNWDFVHDFSVIAARVNRSVEYVERYFEWLCRHVRKSEIENDNAARAHEEKSSKTSAAERISELRGSEKNDNEVALRKSPNQAGSDEHDAPSLFNPIPIPAGNYNSTAIPLASYQGQPTLAAAYTKSCSSGQSMVTSLTSKTMFPSAGGIYGRGLTGEYRGEGKDLKVHDSSKDADDSYLVGKLMDRITAAIASEPSISESVSLSRKSYKLLDSDLKDSNAVEKYIANSYSWKRKIPPPETPSPPPEHPKKIHKEKQEAMREEEEHNRSLNIAQSKELKNINSTGKPELRDRSDDDDSDQEHKRYPALSPAIHEPYGKASGPIIYRPASKSSRMLGVGLRPVIDTVTYQPFGEPRRTLGTRRIRKFASCGSFQEPKQIDRPQRGKYGGIDEMEGSERFRVHHLAIKETSNSNDDAERYLKEIRALYPHPRFRYEKWQAVFGNDPRYNHMLPMPTSAEILSYERELIANQREYTNKVTPPSLARTQNPPASNFSGRHIRYSSTRHQLLPVTSGPYAHRSYSFAHSDPHIPRPYSSSPVYSFVPDPPELHRQQGAQFQDAQQAQAKQPQATQRRKPQASGEGQVGISMNKTQGNQAQLPNIKDNHGVDTLQEILQNAQNSFHKNVIQPAPGSQRQRVAAQQSSSSSMPANLNKGGLMTSAYRVSDATVKQPQTQLGPSNYLLQSPQGSNYLLQSPDTPRMPERQSAFKTNSASQMGEQSFSNIIITTATNQHGQTETNIDIHPRYRLEDYVQVDTVTVRKGDEVRTTTATRIRPKDRWSPY